MTPITFQAIDPKVLMDAAGDALVFQALSQTFLDHAPAIFAQMNTALARGDLADAGRHSHALKGMTMLVGAAELTSRLQQVETAARSGQPPGTEGLAALLSLVLDEVAVAMDENGTI
jgi:HPt (histidine-containing phosphotransfer) domain-containing protein